MFGSTPRERDRPAADRSARAMAIACVLLAVALPAAAFFHLIDAWPGALAGAGAGAGVTLQLADQSRWRTIAAGVLALLPVLAMALALLRAGRCLSALARGEHFSSGAVDNLRGFAALVVLASAASMLVPTLIVLLLTWGRPGQTVLSLSFASQHLILLLFAGVTWQIARVLAKAVALSEEHAQIV